MILPCFPNSDAHSPEKLGRNANIMDCELSYDGIIKTMKKDKENKFLGTIDMYPQEGKYHYDGHRKCGVIYDPVETLEHNGICEKCGKKNNCWCDESYRSTLRS